MTETRCVDAIDPALVTADMVGLARACYGEGGPKLVRYEWDTPAPADRVAMSLLADCLEDAGATCRTLSGLLRGGDLPAYAHREAWRLLYCLALYDDRAAGKELRGIWRRAAARLRRAEERAELEAAGEGDVFERRAVRRHGVRLDEYAYDDRPQGDLARLAEELRTDEEVYGVDDGDGGRYFYVDGDGDAVCMGGLAEACRRYGVPCEEGPDAVMWSERRYAGICVSRRNGVARVYDESGEAYLTAEDWLDVRGALDGIVWVGREIEEMYQGVWDAIGSRADDSLEATYDGGECEAEECCCDHEDDGE